MIAITSMVRCNNPLLPYAIPADPKFSLAIPLCNARTPCRLNYANMQVVRTQRDDRNYKEGHNVIK